MATVARVEKGQRATGLLNQNHKKQNHFSATQKMLWDREPASVDKRKANRKTNTPTSAHSLNNKLETSVSKNESVHIIALGKAPPGEVQKMLQALNNNGSGTSKSVLPNTIMEHSEGVQSPAFYSGGINCMKEPCPATTLSDQNLLVLGESSGLPQTTTPDTPSSFDAQLFLTSGGNFAGTIGSSDSQYYFGESSRACESYENLPENPFLTVGQHPLSTFSIDVDTASYANVRRMLNQNMLPPPGAVRIEELVNYFNYDYPLPEGDDPFSVNVEIAECPWSGSHRLARIGIRGMEYTEEQRPASNLVFLLDVSGSMSSFNKLPLLKKSLGLLIERLSEYDSVAIVVYAGASGLTLSATMCDNKAAILASLDNLSAGGSTNGGAGIQLAYDIASENFIEGGNNRVILATDGDFNVGTTSRTVLLDLIEQKAQTGVFLSVLGFGMGNLKDSTLEMLADKGNGNYAYIDTLNEAQKVLVDDMTGTLITIAKDVKIQVEFNPAQVSAYRLVGYENRILAAKDFNDDTKDAGEIGAGHTVTALYEIVPVGVELAVSSVDPLKYQQVEQEDLAEAAFTGEMMTVKLRYKEPDGEVSSLIEMPIVDQELTLRDASDDFAFAAAVASFGMNLRQSQHIDEFDFNACYDLAESGLGDDPFGYRAEFLTLVAKAITLSGGDR